MKYVGQSVNIRRRIAEHKRDLKKHVHANDKLQKSWNKYGKDNFIFSVLEQCGKDHLTNRETYWVNKLHTMERNIGYNIAVPGPNPMANRHHTEKSKQKMSAYRKIHTKGKNNGFYGKKHTQATLAKISKALKGKMSGNKNPMYKMTGMFNPFYGKTHSDKTRKLMSEHHADFTGGKHPKAKLTENDVKVVIKMLLDGKKTKIIANKFHVGKSCIENIKGHRNWSYLTTNIVFPSGKHRLAETTISPSH